MNNKKWFQGFPPFPWSDELFYVKLNSGVVVRLRPLPDELSYDWEADDKVNTYYTDERIREIVIAWAQAGGSQFIPFEGKL